MIARLPTLGRNKGITLADSSGKPSDSDREEVAILVHLCPDKITLMSVNVTWCLPAPKTAA